MSRRISLFSTILTGGMQDAFVEGVARRRAEAARRDAADVVLVQAVGHPAEQLALPEDRAQQHHVHLVRGADPRVVGEEHVAVADAGVVAAVLERPLHLRVGDAGHVLHVRPEIDELGVLGEDRGIEVERVHRHRRARQALDRRAVLLVHVPQRVAHDLEGDRVDVLLRSSCGGAISSRWKASSAARSRAHAVERDARQLAQLGRWPPHLNRISKLPSASTRNAAPGARPRWCPKFPRSPGRRPVAGRQGLAVVDRRLRARFAATSRWCVCLRFASFGMRPSVCSFRSFGRGVSALPAGARHDLECAPARPSRGRRASRIGRRRASAAASATRLPAGPRAAGSRPR